MNDLEKEMLNILHEFNSHGLRYGDFPRSLDYIWPRVQKAIARAEKGA